jgi:hypothetical protein
MTRNIRHRALVPLALFTALLAAPSHGSDRDGWTSLFDGKTPSAWLIGGEPVPQANVQDGAINPHKVGGGRKLYVMYTKEKFADFVLSCDFKVSKECNSGIFLRMADPADPVQTGLEIQVFDSHGKEKPGKHDCGALYDALAPSKNAMKPAGEWNEMEITARGSNIQVVLNGERVIQTDLARWTEAGKNLDGSTNKYKKALKDFPREGHIGLQDHNHDVWYRNIRIKPLK